MTELARIIEDFYGLKSFGRIDVQISILTHRSEPHMQTTLNAVLRHADCNNFQHYCGLYCSCGYYFHCNETHELIGLTMRVSV